MPSKKKKYNARFPAGRIKKIMQTDEEVGKVAQAVPVIISKALEMFIESLLKKSMQITQSRNAKTLTPSHMKQCILSQSRFDFLKDLVNNIPDASVQEDNENNALAESNDNFGLILEEPNMPEVKENITAPPANVYTQQSTSTAASTITRTPVIQYSPKVNPSDTPKYSFSVNSFSKETREEPNQITISPPEGGNHTVLKVDAREAVPPLIPFFIYGQSNTGDDLCIDEDYDN